MTSTLHARIGASTAIAAALALSTPAFAQEAQPTTTEPAPTVTPAPAPAADTAPAPDTTAPPVATPSTSTRTATVKHTTRTVAAKPAPVTTHVATRTVTTHATAPIAPAPASSASPAAPATSASPVGAPIVQMSAKPAPAPQSSSGNPPIHLNDTELAIAGGALALLALGGGAYALVRRRRENRMLAEDMAAERIESHEPEPAWHAAAVPETVAAPAEASAFAWGQPAEGRKMTRVEQARIGPTPDNPSLSLKKRLKRAAFFDQRDREMAAGNAVPVDAQAGLPEATADAAPVRDRELEAA